MLNKTMNLDISFRHIESGESMIDKYGEMIIIDQSFLSPKVNDKSIYNYICNLLDESEKNYILKINNEKYDSVDVDILEEVIVSKLEEIRVLQENKTDLKKATHTLTEIVLPNVLGVKDLLGDSPMKFSTYILNPAFIEVKGRENKQKTAIFKLINIYENGLIESLDFYNNDYMKINNRFELAHINANFYSYNVTKERYSGREGVFLDEYQLRLFSAQQIYELIPQNVQLDLTSHNFLLDNKLNDTKKEGNKKEILNVIFRPINIIKKEHGKDDIKNFNNMFFYGNKNHSYIFADKEIKNHFQDVSDDIIIASLFSNIYPSLYDSFLDIHIYQKMSDIYGSEDKTNRKSLMSKKQQIYSIRTLKERAYAPSLLSITEFSSSLRESMISKDFQNKLENHYLDMDSLLLEVQQNEIVEGQNRLQIILLTISVIALSVSVFGVSDNLRITVIFTSLLILLIILFYYDKVKG